MVSIKLLKIKHFLNGAYIIFFDTIMYKDQVVATITPHREAKD